MRALREEAGQVVVIVALAFAVMLLGVGLAIDTGQLFVIRRDAQSAADSAAWAGAVTLHLGGNNAAAVAAAFTDAGLSGYVTDANTTVSAESPPLSGIYIGSVNHVLVTITTDVTTTFLTGATGGATRITVTAVGANSVIPAEFAIMSLSPDDRAAFAIGGNGSTSVSGAGILVNSSDSQAAATVVGNGTVAVASPWPIEIVGGYSGSGTFSPVPDTGASPEPNPFTSWQEPDPADYTVRSTSKLSLGSGSTTLQPGVYIGGIAISSSANVTLEPGVYILRGGGLQNTGNGTLTGLGVMIFNTVADHPLSTGNCGDLSLSGNGTMLLSAMTSGEYKGMLFWQDEDCDAAVKWTGNGTVDAVTGTIYAPTAAFEIAGNGTAQLTMNSQIVSQTYKVTGDANISIHYDASQQADPRAPALVG